MSRLLPRFPLPLRLLGYRLHPIGWSAPRNIADPAKLQVRCASTRLACLNLYVGFICRYVDVRGTRATSPHRPSLPTTQAYPNSLHTSLTARLLFPPQATTSQLLADANGWAGWTQSRDDLYFGASDLAAAGSLAVLADELAQQQPGAS